ncbi:MAG TPA: nitrate- and nitrite sensing domain-containing protein [Pseudonocardiaceae bacterium]|nr:nitrate- and nitrite sensing domain-containing protein [Pseudonocardiaceae bacterium]
MENKRGSDKPRSIKRQVAGVVLIPSVTLLVMWVAVSTYLLVDGISSRQVLGEVRQVSIPAAQGLASAQQERQLSMVFLSDNSGNSDSSVGPKLLAQQRQTDQGLSALQTQADAISSTGPASVVDAFDTLSADINLLPKIRGAVTARTISATDVYDYYNNLQDAAIAMFDAQARAVPDAAAGQDGLTVVSLFRASDLMSRASSVISGAFSSGALGDADYLRFVNLVGAYHAQLTQVAPILKPDVRTAYRQLTGTSGWNQLVAAENALITAGPWTHGVPAGLSIDAAGWRTLTGQVDGSLAGMTVSQANESASQALSDGNTRLLGVVIGSVVALLTAIAAIIVALRVSRSLVDRSLVARLARLRQDALDLAHERLPGLVSRLSAGESVDVREELPELDYGRDEIGELASAFNAAQQTAIGAAVKEAQTRNGVHNVFLGIAHRSQALVHRQLKLLDTMEGQEESADQLERLFQLDHLATRARRNAENLIILSGEKPGRRWRRPVALLDVLRAAISETEQYSRVKLKQVPEMSVVGAAVADTIHLIAELVDNATSFSPPRSPAHVTSMLVNQGAVVEIEDQGLGMSDDDRQRANAMMRNPPEFDTMALKADSRFGFFVIARLAARLGIRVQFRDSPGGGTRAVVLIPSTILAEPGAQPELAETAVERTIEFPALEAETADRDLVRLSLRVGARREPPAVEQLSVPNPAPEPEPSPEPKPAAEPEPKPMTDAGLPRRLPQRRPQQNLVRQLRDDDPPAAPTTNGLPKTNGSPVANGTNGSNGSAAPQSTEDPVDAAEIAGGRSAEQIRDAMAAFQRGSIEGRQAGDAGDSAQSGTTPTKKSGQ